MSYAFRKNPRTKIYFHASCSIFPHRVLAICDFKIVPSRVIEQHAFITVGFACTADRTTRLQIDPHANTIPYGVFTLPDTGTDTETDKNRIV